MTCLHKYLLTYLYIDKELKCACLNVAATTTPLTVDQATPHHHQNQVALTLVLSKLSAARQRARSLCHGVALTTVSAIMGEIHLFVATTSNKQQQ